MTIILKHAVHIFPAFTVSQSLCFANHTKTFHDFGFIHFAALNMLSIL